MSDDKLLRWVRDKIEGLPEPTLGLKGGVNRAAALAIVDDALHAAMSSEPASTGLDVERLARAMHNRPHHYRGGADDGLAKFACTQFGWDKSKCLREATALAAEYARLSESVPPQDDTLTVNGLTFDRDIWKPEDGEKTFKSYE